MRFRLDDGVGERDREVDGLVYTRAVGGDASVGARRRPGVFCMMCARTDGIIGRVVVRDAGSYVDRIWDNGGRPTDVHGAGIRVGATARGAAVLGTAVFGDDSDNNDAVRAGAAWSDGDRSESE